MNLNIVKLNKNQHNIDYGICYYIDSIGRRYYIVHSCKVNKWVSNLTDSISWKWRDSSAEEAREKLCKSTSVRLQYQQTICDSDLNRI